MPDKKKPLKVGEDESTLKIPALYRKKCECNGLTPCKIIKDKIENALEESKLESLQLWEPIGPIQVRAFIECLIELNYQHLRKMRLWKVDLQDEGLRMICNYSDRVNSLEEIDLMGNGITSLGCQFLGKTLAGPAKIRKLRLDNNPIGNQGLYNLAIGIRENAILEKLSLNACGIDQHAFPYIQDIMANINCKLRTLKLEGNSLKNQGLYQVLRVVKSCGRTLERLDLGDIGMNLKGYDEKSVEAGIVEELLSILKNNTSIAKYNFSNNWMPDELVKEILDTVRENKSIFRIGLPESISFALKEAHAEILKKRKLKKKTKPKKSSKKTS